MRAHGVSLAYRGCHGCEVCREAHRNRIRAQKERRRALRHLGPDGRWWAPPAGPGGPLEHGTASTYDNWCCRCPACTHANRKRRKRGEE